MLVFIDFEASSLSPDSWPIEIGTAWLREGRTETLSALIRPHPSWPVTAWSEESARVHKIPRSALDAAEPAEAVAKRFARLLVKAGSVVSDAPEWDQHWLKQLLELLPDPPMITLRDFDHLAARRFDRSALERVYARLNGLHVPHRAGPDAARLATAWVAGLASPG